jgi:hypothetical protein
MFFVFTSPFGLSKISGIWNKNSKGTGMDDEGPGGKRDNAKG